MFDPSNITAAILAGGLGTRLQQIVRNKQKVLAKVKGSPFLKHLLNQLNGQGFRNIVLCTGYLGNQVKKEFGGKYKNLDILYSHESFPLDTAGALRLALPILRSETILVMNGDSFFGINLRDFLEFHNRKKANVSLALSYQKDTSRYGKVRINYKDEIVGFEEKKEGGGKGWINGGIYLFHKSTLNYIEEHIPVSLERDIFPMLISNKFYGYKGKGAFIDIGTPESYKGSEAFFAEANKRRFVILDRDGTIIEEKNYLSDPGGVELIPGAVEALKRLKNMGLGLIVITNQSGVGRGYFSMKILEKIHQRLNELLLKEGIILDDIYFCPHMPEDDCLCRKPNTGMVVRAMQKHKFDPKSCFVIGDNKSDIELGRRLGAITILVRSGYGKRVAKEFKLKPAYVVDDLSKSVNIIKRLINNQ